MFQVESTALKLQTSISTNAQRPAVVRRSSVTSFPPAGDSLEKTRPRRLSDTSKIDIHAHQKFLETFNDFCPLTQTAIKDLPAATFCIADQHIYEREAFRNLILFQGTSGRSPLRPTESLAQDARLLGLLPCIGVPSGQKLLDRLMADLMNSLTNSTGLQEEEISRQLSHAMEESLRRLQQSPDLFRRFSAVRSSLVDLQEGAVSRAGLMTLARLVRIIQSAPVDVRQPWLDFGMSLAPQWPRELFELSGNLLLDSVALFEQRLSALEVSSSLSLPVGFMNAFLAARSGGVVDSFSALTQTAINGAHLPQLTPTILSFFDNVESLEALDELGPARELSRNIRQTYLSAVCQQRGRHMTSLASVSSKVSLIGSLIGLAPHVGWARQPWVARTGALAVALYLAYQVGGAFSHARRVQAFTPAWQEHRHHHHHWLMRTLVAIVDWPFFVPVLSATAAVAYGSAIWLAGSTHSDTEPGPA